MFLLKARAIFLCTLAILWPIHSIAGALDFDRSIPIEFAESLNQDHRVRIETILNADEGKFLRQTVKNIYDRDLLFKNIKKVSVQWVADGARKVVYRVDLIDTDENTFVFTLKLLKRPYAAYNSREFAAFQRLSSTGLVARFGVAIPTDDNRGFRAFTTEFINGVNLKQLRALRPELAEDEDTIREVVSTWMKAWIALGKTRSNEEGEKRSQTISFQFADLNPGNIMFRMENGRIYGTPVIVDLGCCHRMGPLDALFLMSQWHAHGIEIENRRFSTVWDGVVEGSDQVFIQALSEQIQQFKTVLQSVSEILEDHNSGVRVQEKAQGSRLEAGGKSLERTFELPFIKLSTNNQTLHLNAEVIHFEEGVPSNQQTLLKNILLSNNATFLHRTIQNIHNHSLAPDAIHALSVTSMEDHVTKISYHVEITDLNKKLFSFKLHICDSKWAGSSGVKRVIQSLQLLQGTGIVPQLGAVIRHPDNAYLAYSEQLLETVMTVRDLSRSQPDWIQEDYNIREIARTFMHAWLVWNAQELKPDSWQKKAAKLWVNNVNQQRIGYLTKDNIPYGLPIILDFPIRRWRRLKPLEILIEMRREYVPQDNIHYKGMIPILQGFADSLGKERAQLFFGDALSALEQLERLVVQTIETT